MRNPSFAALTLALLSGPAFALDSGLSFQVLSSATRTEAANPAPTSALLNFATGTSVQLGELFATRAGTFPSATSVRNRAT